MSHPITIGVSAKLKRFLLLSGAGLAFVLLSSQIGLAAAYNGRIYPGVSVSGVPIGGMNIQDAKSILKQKVAGSRIKLVAAGRYYDLGPADVGAYHDLNATLQQAYLAGRDQPIVPLGLWRTYRGGAIKYSFKVDNAAQNRFVQKIVSASGRAPIDASIIVKNGLPEVRADEDGQALDAEELRLAIENQMASINQSPARLELETQKARIRTADTSTAVEETKKLLAVPVTIQYQGKLFKPTTADMSEWIAYDKSLPADPPGLKSKLSLDGVKHYLQSVALKINQNPVNRKVRIENGVQSEDQAGKDGLQLDQDGLADQIAKAITNRQAASLTATTKPVPYQTEYNRVVTLDYGRYVEINLSRQHLWVYQDKQVIYQSPLTSGATGAGFPTVTGLFSVQAKQTNRNLNGYAIGYNYNVFVKYWMPFFGNYGLHDASWRSSFGGSDYYYGGSHGCVNLPFATAAFLFDWATVGTPVWIHK